MDKKKQLEKIVLTGLQVFIALNLQNRPAQEVIQATAKVWIDILWSARIWSDETLEALKKGFMIASREVEIFPAPATVLKYMPVVVKYSVALPKPARTDKEKQEIKKNIRELTKILKTKGVKNAKRRI